MCMLTYLPADTMPNVERLKNGTVSNRDGHGWAIVVVDPDNGDRIVTGYSMNAEAAIESFRLARKQHPEGPALFHSRYTTGGVVDESNCHPFKVCGDAQTVLAHNGVLSLNPPRGDDRSDTRYFAEEFGPMLYPGMDGGFNLNSKRGRRRLREWLGNPNKFVILTVDPVFKRYAWIINEEQGIWEDDGCWYSNTGYKQKTYGIGYGLSSYGWDDGWDDYYRSTKRKHWWDDAPDSVWDRLAKNVDTSGAKVIDKESLALARESQPAKTSCDYCGALNTWHHALGYCKACGTCGECYGDAFSEGNYGCDCYWPMGTHPARQRRLEAAFADQEEVITLGSLPALPAGNADQEDRKGFRVTYPGQSEGEGK